MPRARDAREFRAHWRDARDPSRRSTRSSASSPSSFPITAAIARSPSCIAPRWPDERIVKATLATIAAMVAQEPMERTALILVGPVLGASDFRESALYDPDYRRRYRRRGHRMTDERARNGVRATSAPCRSKIAISSSIRASPSAFAAVADAASRDREPDVDLALRAANSRTSMAVLARSNLAGERRLAVRLEHALGEPIEIDRAAPRMQIEQALSELRHLGEAARDRHPGDRMAAQIFEHAADEIAHVDERHLAKASAELRTAASEVEPVAPATWSRPQARATSMPRWIEWIQAAQE